MHEEEWARRGGHRGRGRGPRRGGGWGGPPEFVMRGGPFGGGPRFARGPRVRRGDVRAAALSLLAGKLARLR